MAKNEARGSYKGCSYKKRVYLMPPNFFQIGRNVEFDYGALLLGSN